MRFGLYASVVAFTVLGSAASSQKAALNWTSQQAETLRHFRALVQIDTSNPPGNEAKIVEYPREGPRVRRDPIDEVRARSQSPESRGPPERKRLEAAGADAGTHRRRWRAARQMARGSIWGGPARWLCVGPWHDRRQGQPDRQPDDPPAHQAFRAALDRDLIFLAESGEEADPTGVGIRFMVDRHFEAIEAEFAIAEGNGATIEDGRVRTVQISTTEKVPRRVRLIATGTSGHGSVRASTMR